MNGFTRAGCMLVSVGVLVGCGQAPATSPRREAPTPVSSGPATTPLPGPSANPTDGQALLTSVRQTFEACKGVEAEVKSWSEGHFKSGKRVSELRRNMYR